MPSCASVSLAQAIWPRSNARSRRRSPTRWVGPAASSRPLCSRLSARCCCSNRPRSKPTSAARSSLASTKSVRSPNDGCAIWSSSVRRSAFAGIQTCRSSTPFQRDCRSAEPKRRLRTRSAERASSGGAVAEAATAAEAERTGRGSAPASLVVRVLTKGRAHARGCAAAAAQPALGLARPPLAQYRLGCPFGELRQAILQRFPGRLVRYPGVCLRLLQERRVEAAQTDAQDLWGAGEVRIQGRAAGRAEGAQLSRRRFELAQRVRTTDEPKVSA